MSRDGGVESRGVRTLVIGIALACVGLALTGPMTRAATGRGVCHRLSRTDVLVSDRDYVVSANELTGALYACRRATGGLRTLMSSDPDEGVTFAHVVLRGPWMAAAIDISDAQGMSSGDAEDIYLYDLAARSPQRAVLDPCPTTYGDSYVEAQNSDGCYPTSLQVNSRGDVSWTLDYRFSDISWMPSDLQCLSAHLCVAADDYGAVLRTENPFTGSQSWQRTQVEPFKFDAQRDLTCPSAVGCFGFGSRGLTLFTGLASGAVEVQPTDSPSPLRGGVLACPTSALCVDATGDLVYGSADVGANLSDYASGFSPLVDFGVTGQSDLTCADAGLCVALDSPGQQAGYDAAPTSPVRIAASTSPATAGSWQQATLDVPGDGPSSVTCPADNLCVGFNSDGYLYTSTDPAADQWAGALLAGNSAYQNGGPGLSSLSCPSTQLCVATDAEGDVLTSTNPAGGASTWQIQSLDPSSAHAPSDAAPFTFNVMTCAAPTLCVLAGVARERFGSSLNPPPTTGATTDLWTSTDPGSGRWSERVLNNTAVSELQCVAGAGCVGFDDAGDLLTNGDPTAAASEWRTQRFDSPPCALAHTTCEIDQIWVHDSARTHLADESPAEAAHEIRNVALSSDPARLTWTLNGRPRTLTLSH